MNPEAAELEIGEESEITSIRTREDFLHTSVQEIRAMSPEELERFHDQLLPHLGKPEKPSGGFSEYVSKLPAGKQRQMSKPAIRSEYLRGYLEARISALRSVDQVTAQRRAQEERKDSLDERLSREDLFIHEAESRIEARFVDWNLARQVIDQGGRPSSLHPEDQAFVEKIEQQQDAEREAGNEFGDITARLEVGFADGLKRMQTFGDDADVRVDPSSKFDDFARGVDMIARIRPGHMPNQEIILGIDFTITNSDADIAKKLRRNVHHPVRTTRYGTRDVPKALQYFPVVLSVDRKRAERITRHEAIIMTAKEQAGGKHFVDDSTADIERYHDAAVFQYAVLEEAIAQLNVQAESLADRGVNTETQEQYEAAITYLESVLADRKNLQALAGLETSQEKSVYRVADTAFIRSVSEAKGGDGASPVA